MTKGDVRIAIIGCGAVAELAHLPAAARVHGGRVTLLIDPNAARREQLARAFKIALTAGEAKECPDAFDAAIVAAPHALHAPIALQLAALGKSILVEKPLAHTSAACDAMIDAASKHNVLLGVGLMRRFLRSHRFVREILASGVFGAVRSFEFAEGSVYYWPVASDFFFRKESAGGGVLVDTGAHTLDSLLQWLGPVQDVEYFDDAEGGVEANCLMKLRMRSGATGTVELSRTRRLRNTAIITLDHAVLEVSLASNELKLSLPHHPFVVGGPIVNREQPNAIQDYLDVMTEQLQDWIDAISRGSRPFVDGRSAAASVQLIEQCYEQRQPLALPWDDMAVPATEVVR